MQTASNRGWLDVLLLTRPNWSAPCATQSRGRDTRLRSDTGHAVSKDAGDKWKQHEHIDGSGSERAADGASGKAGGEGGNKASGGWREQARKVSKE